MTLAQHFSDTYDGKRFSVIHLNLCEGQETFQIDLKNVRPKQIDEKIFNWKP